MEPKVKRLYLEVQMFKSDTGKYYMTREFEFPDDDFTRAIDDLRKWQSDPEQNQSGFVYVVTGVGSIKNAHPKLIGKTTVWKPILTVDDLPEKAGDYVVTLRKTSEIAVRYISRDSEFGRGNYCVEYFSAFIPSLASYRE